MKSIMLLMIVCGWWHKSVAQSQGGLEQYYYMNNKAVTISPIVWYQTKKGWYLEGRYNYEADKALSIYAGKTFEKKSIVSYAISPMIGALVGTYKGLSIAANADVKYKKLYLSLQSQYTFSLSDRSINFIYNWCDLGYQVSDWLSAGLSVQQTRQYRTKVILEKGVFVKAGFGRWEFPVYFFNPAKKEKYIVMGLNFMLQSNIETSHSELYL